MLNSTNVEKMVCHALCRQILWTDDFYSSWGKPLPVYLVSNEKLWVSRGWQTFSMKSQIINIFSFLGHMVSVVTT